MVSAAYQCGTPERGGVGAQGPAGPMLIEVRDAGSDPFHRYNAVFTGD